MSEYQAITTPVNTPSEEDDGLRQIFDKIYYFFTSDDISWAVKTIVFILFCFALSTIGLAFIFGFIDHYQHIILAVVLINNLVLDIYLADWYRRDVIHAITVKILIVLIALFMSVSIHAYIWGSRDC